MGVGQAEKVVTLCGKVCSRPMRAGSEVLKAEAGRPATLNKSAAAVQDEK